ncbi:MAG: hypothetical protein ACJAUG_003306 [Halioglobus sp.]|jgi:hypothetical protein
MIRIAIKAYLVYLALAILLIMPALNFFAPWYVEKNFQRDLSTEVIFFNPFTLNLVVRKASLPERNGDPFTGFSLGEMNLSLASIWTPGFVFDAARFENFYADVTILKDGTFNFSDLVPAAEPAENPPQVTQDSGLPGVTIRDFYFHSKRIQFTDESREKPFSTHYDGLQVAVRDLSTLVEEGKPYSFEAKDEAGGVLSWEGHVSVPGAHSEGSLSLSNISLAPLSRFIEPWVKFELTKGHLNMAGRYRISWADALSYKVEQASLTLKELALAPRDTDALSDTEISLGELHIGGVTVDGAAETVSVESVSLDVAIVKGWSDGLKVSVAEMLAPRIPVASEPEPEDPANNWSIAVNTTTVQDSEIHWRSEYTEPALISVTPIAVRASKLQWPLAGDTSADLSLSINNQASLTLTAQLTLDSGSGTVQYALADLPLAWFNPNIPKGITASIETGLAGLSGSINLEQFAPVKIGSDGAISNFSITVEEEENAVTSWDSVRWKKLGIDLNQKKLILEELLINKYSGRLHIHSDGTVNAQRAFAAEAEPSPEEPTQEHDLTEEERPWSFSIPSVSISDSDLDFMDESLSIPFRTVIGSLSGEINGLGSNPSDEASVDLNGSVDGYAPVTLAGTAKPFAKAPALDMGLTFDGVDLARLSPYSGTYAGHSIDRGVLNLNLHYKLNDSKLVGDNKLVIEQLKLGDKIESDKAVDLPLSLAIALLTDASGVIDLAVPVSGNIDDPEFGLGSVIFSALVNIITKAITAPFSLLANLIGSEEDLQRVTFPSGTAVLDEAGKSKLMELHTALTQRPELILVIAGRLHPKADLMALQKQLLAAQFLEDGMSQEQWESKGPQWEDTVSAKYKPLGMEKSEPPISIANQFKAVAASIKIEPGQLINLAEERAVAVKRFLVNEAQLPAERSVIEKFDAADKANSFSGTELKIDS